MARMRLLYAGGETSWWRRPDVIRGPDGTIYRAEWRFWRKRTLLGVEIDCEAAHKQVFYRQATAVCRRDVHTAYYRVDLKWLDNVGVRFISGDEIRRYYAIVDELARARRARESA